MLLVEVKSCLVNLLVLIIGATCNAVDLSLRNEELWNGVYNSLYVQVLWHCNKFPAKS